MGSWRGSYMDGERAVRTPVTVTLSDRGLRLEQPDGEVLLWAFEGLELLGGEEPGEPVRFTRRAGRAAAVLEVRDPSILAAVAERGPGGRFRRPPQRGTLTLVAAGLLATTVGLFGWFWVWGLPWLAEAATEAVPVAWEQAMGRSIVDDTTARLPPCRDPRKAAALNAIMDRLLEGAGSPYRYRVQLVHSPEMNAFCAPGGNVLVLEGLLARMPSAEALAGVLAHEMQHAERRHVTRAIVRDFTGSILLWALIGDSEGLGRLFSTADALRGLALSRADEDEADRLGLARVEATGLDSRGMLAAWEVMAREGEVAAGMEQGLRYLMDHPPSSERLATLKRLARPGAVRLRPLALPATWEEVRRPCKP